ncbi:MAG: sialidase family protein [bacterium]
MRAAVPVILLSFAALSGCMGESPPPTELAIHGWALDCSMGNAERAIPGASWAQDCEARASHTMGQKQEIWVAVNPTDSNNVVIGAKDLNPDLSSHCVWNGISTTVDGGRSWTDVLLGGKYADRKQGSPYYGYACNTDPMGVFTADGTLHWVVELYNLEGHDGYGPLGADPSSGRGVLQPGWKLVLAISHDKGLSFPEDQAVTLEYGDGIAALNDYSRITNNPTTGSTVTVINTYYPGFAANAVPLPIGGVVCSVIAYRGAGEPVQPLPLQPTLQTGTANPNGINCNAIAADSKGTITLAGIGAAAPTGGATTSWFATSTDDAASFTDFRPGFTFKGIPGKFAESPYRTGTNFEVAYDNSMGNHSAHPGMLFAVTAEDASGRGGDDADIFVHASPDGGATWKDAVKVNQDGAKSHQFMPNIVVARDGSIHVFYMDKSYDAAHSLIDVTHAMSLDGGQTWSNERVTTVSWDGALGKHQEDFPFIGDYTGIGTSGNLVWGGFPDSSNGQTTVVAAIKVELHG